MSSKDQPILFAKENMVKHGSKPPPTGQNPTQFVGGLCLSMSIMWSQTGHTKKQMKHIQFSIDTHTYTHPFNSPLPRTTWMSR